VVDKILHLLIGIVLGFIHLYLGIFAGIGKEVYDYFVPGHTCDVVDMVVSIVGAFIGFAIREVLK